MKNPLKFSTVYNFISAAISVLLYLHVPYLVEFLLGSLITFILLRYIYLSFKNFKTSDKLHKVLRIGGALVLFAMFCLSVAVSQFSGFNSSYCYNLVAKNMFTNKLNVYCNYPPWYSEIIGGEEARKELLKDCLNRESAFYEDNPDYCDYYKGDNIDEDWTKYPNP